jgi:hypothetical protein
MGILNLWLRICLATISDKMLLSFFSPIHGAFRESGIRPVVYDRLWTTTRNSWTPFMGFLAVPLEREICSDMVKTQQREASWTRLKRQDFVAFNPPWMAGLHASRKAPSNGAEEKTVISSMMSWQAKHIRSFRDPPIFLWLSIPRLSAETGYPFTSSSWTKDMLAPIDTVNNR